MAPTVLSVLEYFDLPFIPPGGGPPNYYTHQGWLGAWGTYTYFGDGKVIVSGPEQGLFVLNSRVKSSAKPAISKPGPR